MTWRRITRAYVGVGAGVGVDDGAGVGVDVGEAVGVGVVGVAVGVDVVGVAVLHPTTSCKTKAVRGLYAGQMPFKSSSRHKTDGMPRCAAVRRRRARDRRASPAKNNSHPPMQSANTVRMRTRRA